MSDKNNDILCLCNLELFGSVGERYFNGFTGTAMFNGFNPIDGLEWVPRQKAEVDRNYKQVIPYVALYHHPSRTFWTYQRGKAGGEARLHAKRSIGFGGHVDYTPGVTVANEGDFEDIVVDAALRELKEEIGLTLVQDQLLHAVGYVNEDESDVGCVHLGICFFISLTNNQHERLKATESCIVDLKPTSFEDICIDLDKYELWSQYFFNTLLLSRTILHQLA